MESPREESTVLDLLKTTLRQDLTYSIQIRNSHGNFSTTTAYNHRKFHLHRHLCFRRRSLVSLFIDAGFSSRRSVRRRLFSQRRRLMRKVGEWRIPTKSTCRWNRSGSLPPCTTIRLCPCGCSECGSSSTRSSCSLVCCWKSTLFQDSICLLSLANNWLSQMSISASSILSISATWAGGDLSYGSVGISESIMVGGAIHSSHGWLLPKIVTSFLALLD